MQSSDNREISRGALVDSLFRFLGKSFRGIRLTDKGIMLLAKRPMEYSFAEMAGPARVKHSLWYSAIQVPLENRRQVNVYGLNRNEISSFVESLNKARRRSIGQLFEVAGRELQMLSKVVDNLGCPKRYPSACLLEPYLKRVNELATFLPKSNFEDSVTAEQVLMFTAVLSFKRNPKKTRDIAIKSFVESELSKMRDFFDSIESNPLTSEQRLSVVTDEDATLVLAGAGSGKTSVIVAKATYLIQQDIRKPEEILLMAFGKKAADEMSSRIEERCGSPVVARTFHALGYGIIADVEGQAPAMAPHASDDSQYRALLRDILLNDIAKQKHCEKLLTRWFSELYFPYKNEWDFKTKDEYYQYVESHELRTLQGERVRSFEECEIANWLFLHGIAYEYEPIYEHDLPENDRRAYTPDFRLTDSGVYIEHFGVRKASNGIGDSTFVTAPHVDRKSYLEGMEWKRQVHRDNGTTLIETYSYERVEGCLLDSLREKLAPYVTPTPIPADQIFDTLFEKGKVDAFTQLMGTFLRHYKSSGLTVEQCRQRAASLEDPLRCRAFLDIFVPLMDAYQRRLGGKIDFEDMITRATDYVRSGKYLSPYRHLLVDEFQDISAGRGKLLRALKDQHPDARIFAVGDDWQSIYRFTGSDIHLMRNFGREFGGTFCGDSGVHSSVDLGRTFRSIDKIALPARSFVLKNPSQITKEVVPAGTSDVPAIKVAYYAKDQESVSLQMALGEIEKMVSSGYGNSVLLLGRYNFVKPDNFKALQASYPSLSIRFMTVHSSKGLEAEHVIILRADSGRLGFPSEITDDPLLNMVLPEPEQFEHAEERRLFYVALTRAKKSVIILSNRESPSTFVRELINNAEYDTIELGERGVAEHRCSECGGRMLAPTSKTGILYFECEHRFLCGNRLRVCTVCNSDIPAKDSANPSMLVCSCGAVFPACPECKDGWLVERNGPYGRFLGCINYPSCKGKRNL